MPKKTKKEKILAELHRKLKQISISPSYSSPDFVKREFPKNDNQVSLPAIPKYSLNKETIIKPQNIKNDLDYAFLKPDLIKITIFTFSAVILQAVLYFILNPDKINFLR